MNRYYIEVTCKASELDADEIEAKLDQIADAVYDLTDVIDADLGADLSVPSLDFTMFVDAPDPAEALGRAMAATRSALHAAGHSTPGWEQHFEAIRQEVQKQDPLPA